LQESIAFRSRLSAAAWQKASDRRTIAFRALQQPFRSVDYLETPTLPEPAQAVDAVGKDLVSELYARWAAYLYPFNLTGHPAASVPCGLTSSGLPIGLQVIEPWHAEARMLQILSWWEEQRPWAHLRPGLAHAS
jgi:Asp-tRNA(Asn)/Glu-tRNA(Gln) amidotransferase A subunit family amidase